MTLGWSKYSEKLESRTMGGGCCEERGGSIQPDHAERGSKTPMLQCDPLPSQGRKVQLSLPPQGGGGLLLNNGPVGTLRRRFKSNTISVLEKSWVNENWLQKASLHAIDVFQNSRPLRKLQNISYKEREREREKTPVKQILCKIMWLVLGGCMRCVWMRDSQQILMVTWK